MVKKHINTYKRRWDRQKNMTIDAFIKGKSKQMFLSCFLKESTDLKGHLKRSSV